MHIGELSLSHFRCFREQQTAHLAPLTLLVGANSTGKTSFLALTRVLWDLAVHDRFPSFKTAPFDLGSFDEIAHHRGGRGRRAKEFSAGFALHDAGRARKRRSDNRGAASRFHAVFGRDGAAAVPTVRRIEDADSWIEVYTPSDGGDISLRFSTRNGQWALGLRDVAPQTRALLRRRGDSLHRELLPVGYLTRRLIRSIDDDSTKFVAEAETVTPPTRADLQMLFRLELPIRLRLSQWFSGAAVRSEPRRTYDPSHELQDPEGEYIPMFLSRVSRRDERTWNSLKASLEAFGRESGLFDEISIKTLGSKAGGPFQIQIRKFGKSAKGPGRNIIDVGYGVSQVLPVVTELLRPKGPKTFLLQQPEVHLHPSAQAALGSLFCDVASGNRQLLVETHSDHLIDRIRMDVRDRKNGLKPEDVSILYFERRNLSVKIHSLGWDENGNLLAKAGRIPDGYREFFRLETARSLGLSIESSGD